MTGFGEGLRYVWVEAPPLEPQKQQWRVSALPPPLSPSTFGPGEEEAGGGTSNGDPALSLAEVEIVQSWRVQVDLRSVNARGLEISLRHPLGALGEKQLRQYLGQRLGRGRVEARVEIQRYGAESSAQPERWTQIRPLLERSMQELLRVEELAQTAGLRLQPVSGLDLLRFAQSEAQGPGDLVRSEERREAEVRAALEALGAAADALLTMRRSEGQAIEEQLRGECQALETLHRFAKERQPEIVAALSQRFVERSQELLAGLARHLAPARADDADGPLPSEPPSDLPSDLSSVLRDEGEDPAGAWQQRIAQEVALAAGRSDVQEELVRIAAHLGQMKQLLDEEAAVGQGKRLTFLCQELQREWNTFGNKSADHECALQLVQAKAALERIREQAQNVE